MLLTHKACLENNQSNAFKEAKLNFATNLTQARNNKKKANNNNAVWNNNNQGNWNGNNGNRNRGNNWNGNFINRGGYNSGSGKNFGRGQGNDNWNNWNGNQGRGNFGNAGGILETMDFLLVLSTVVEEEVKEISSVKSASSMITLLLTAEIGST